MITVDELLTSMGRAGRRLAAMSACEGAAGNISVCVADCAGLADHFPNSERLELPLAVPRLAGRVVLATGSGRRLGEIGDDPAAAVGAVLVDRGGTSATLLSSPRRRFARLTSELNSHLAVHDDRISRDDLPLHAVVHAQPLQLTLLSHIPQYRAPQAMSRRLFRWEPETLINLPEGIGVLEFMLPGSAELEAATLEGLRHHRLVVWSKHGVMARSDESVTRVVDYIEYVETAARYELLDGSTGGRAEGLSDAELHRVVEAFGVPTKLF